MSTSLGRLTLDLAADPTQLNRDLDAVKAHVQSVARDIETSLRNAFSAGMATPGGGASSGLGGSTGSSSPFGGLRASLATLVADIRRTYATIGSMSPRAMFSGLLTSARAAFTRLPTIASIAIRGLPLALASIGLVAGARLGSSIIGAAKTGLSGLRKIGQTAGRSFVSAFQSSLSAVSFGAFAQAGTSAFNTVSGLIGSATNQVKTFGSSLFDTLKEVQTFDARLKTFVTDTEKRAKLNERLNSFAATTPFELKDIRESAIKNLSTMADPSKLNLDKYMADLKALGDIAAGSQQPVGELADKFAKARSEGKAQNEDLQEWAGRGIPIYQELGKLLGATAAEVRQMATDGKVDFEMLSAAVSSMTQEGGVFFKSMENQAGTLQGKLSNISDTFYQFKEVLAKAFEPLANLGVDIFGEVVSGLKDSKSVMGDITKETQKLADHFKQNPEIAKALNKSLQDIVRGAMKGLINGVKSFVEFLKENPNIIKQIATGISTVVKNISKAVGFAIDLATTFGGAVVDQINKNQDLINGIVSTVQDVIKFAIEIASVFGGAVLEALNQNNYVTDSMRVLVESLIGLWNENKEIIAVVGQAIGSLIGTALKVCIDLVIGILKYLKEHPAIIQTIATGIQLVAKVFEGIVIAVGKILEGIGWVVQKVTEWANSSVPVQTFFDSVGTAVNGIITGIDGIINKTFDWLKSLEPVQNALSAIAGMGAGDSENADLGREGMGNVADSVNGMMGGSGKGSDGVYWGKAAQYSGSDLSGLTDRGKQALEALKNPNVRAFLDSVAVAELGDEAAAKGGYGYRYGDVSGKETFDPNTLKQHPEQFVSKWGLKSNATGRYQVVQHRDAKVWDEEKGRLGLKDFKPQSQELLAVSRMMYRGILDEVKKGNVAGVLRRSGHMDASSEWASIQGNPYGQGTVGGKRSNFLSNFEKFRQQAQATPQQGGGSAPNWDEGGISNRGGKVVQNQGLRIRGSSGEGMISNYEQLATHHHNSRGGGRRKKGNRTFIQSPTKAQGVLEEARTTGTANGAHIKKDFQLMDKNGNMKVPSPSPASGIVQDIFPGVGGVVIGDGKGNRLATSLHLSNIRVKVGQRVSYGQIIGTQDGVSGYPVHSHVEMPLNEFRRYIKDIQTGRFGSKPAEDESGSKGQMPNFDESGVGSISPKKAFTTVPGGSRGNAQSKSGGTMLPSRTSRGSSSPAKSSTSVSKPSSNSGGSSSSTTPTASKPSAISISPQAKRDLLTARQKQQEATYKEISAEIEFSQRSEKVADKQKRELEDSARKREQEQAKAKLELDLAKAETPEAKKILERNLARFDVDAKYKDEEVKLQRQRQDLVASQSNKQAALKKAEERKNEFIKSKKAAGEEYTPADLEKFKIAPDEGAMMDFSKAIKDLDKMIASQRTLKELELQTLGISESSDDRRERRSAQRERDIEQIKREGETEINNLKKLESSVTDENVRKQLQDKIAGTELKMNARIELMPIDDQLEDLNQALSEVLSAGVKKDDPQVQEIQKQIDELNKQKTSIASKSGLDLTVFENERKQAEVARNRQKEAETRELEHRTKIADIDSKIASSRSDSEKASLEFEKERLDLTRTQSEEQQPLLDKLADLQKDKDTLLGSGVKESSEEMKVLNETISNINGQLTLMKSEGATALQTLTTESTKAIEEAKRADASRMFEKESLLMGSDVSNARLGQMQERGADPYKISAFEKEIALSQEALRYRQEMADIEEKIASFRGTNAELSAQEENILRNNAAAVHEINLEKVNENVRTLGKDLSDIGKGAVKDFFGQLVSGSMDFNSIMQNIIGQIGNLAVELIQSQLFGEGGIFGTKKKKNDSGGSLLDGLTGAASGGAGGMFGTTGATPMQPAFVSVVGGAGDLGGMLSGGMGGSPSGGDFISSIFGGGSLGFSKGNPLPIDMVSADKNAFSGLGDVFSGILGGGSGGEFGNIISSVLGGGSGSPSGGGGNIFSNILGMLPSIFGFSEGGRVQGLGINKMPIDNNPIAKALRAERASSGKKPVLAVLHENELVLNEKQQKMAGIFDVPRFDSGGVVGGTMNNFNKNNQTNINMSFNTADNSTGGIDPNALKAVINQEIIRQQGSGGSLGRGSYSRRGR